MGTGPSAQEHDVWFCLGSVSRPNELLRGPDPLCSEQSLVLQQLSRFSLTAGSDLVLLGPNGSSVCCTFTSTADSGDGSKPLKPCNH